MTNDEKFLYMSIYKYIEENQKNSLNEKDIILINTIEEDSIEFMQKIGIRSNLKGYKYLKESIYLELLSDTKYNIKEYNTLIKAIAEENNTGKLNIERSMRYAIEVLKNSRDYNELNEVIGKKIFSKYEIPSNLEFVFSAAEKIRYSKSRRNTFRN
ncbi:sporulation initiation factor Spo0A C-terminal domain-containing protein [Peptacetobacter sp.]|uniref:sporulation initiation factor Spo0A C-terminal domain-containing protein n=1 Tax=Peptacetobacter sp. TaxID=2991975 RepID=UPI00261CF733|nr:sporulation initiation factor Spo0A C-terminal domain-containing protein [Peptacetobacter sp.]